MLCNHFDGSRPDAPEDLAEFSVVIEWQACCEDERASPSCVQHGLGADQEALVFSRKKKERH